MPNRKLSCGTVDQGLGVFEDDASVRLGARPARPQPPDHTARFGSKACVLSALLLALLALLATQPVIADDTDPESAKQDAEEKWTPPEPPGALERRDERERMVRNQIAEPLLDRIPVTDRAVLTAMRAVPRHAFVPSNLSRHAYRDQPLPIGHAQTISQPYIVAAMTERLGLKPSMKVLEIGTGSGYQAAVLAHLTPHVYSIEIIEPLAGRAAKTFRKQRYDRIRTRTADGYFGWEEHAPFDAIIVTCAAGHLPPPLWQQLKPEGRIVIPIGGPYDTQRLVVVTKTRDGKRRSKSIMAVRFVPMTGRAAGKGKGKGKGRG